MSILVSSSNILFCPKYKNVLFTDIEGDVFSLKQTDKPIIQTVGK